MALKKSELYSSLWASCDELRGGMDASQYKDYVLVLLFVKYVSDRFAGQPYAAITIPKGASFADMVALKGKPDIGDQINKKILGPLAQANRLAEMPDFNDATKLGSGKEMVERLTNLIAIFESPALDFSKNRAEGDDLLGDAYEYLMRHFATESGKSKGQFYTPAEVSRLIAQLLGVRHANVNARTTVYDPTCGSGSLLLKVADEAAHGRNVRVALYGQEKDNATAALARMNMILHDYATAVIEQGNTLASPRFLDGDTLKTFDYVVANPPFSDKRWSTGLDAEHDPHQRFKPYGIPPAKQGDYAYLLHILRSLKNAGKGACILPHGVLFRGGAEAGIRRGLVQRGYIKGLIGLPPNLFYGTSIPACIVVVDKEGAAARKGIFMIDASKGVTKDGPKNRLREQDVHRIVDTFAKQAENHRYSRLVPVAEIADPKNDYNLNLPRYIDSSEPEDLQDIDGHLRGGIPDRDLDALDRYWEVLPRVRAELFESAGRSGYSRLKTKLPDLKPTILSHPESAALNQAATDLFDRWTKATRPRLEGLKKGDHPKTLIETVSEELLTAFRDAALLDAYDVYQHLMDYWARTMQDDCYLIVVDGWKAGAQPREIVQVKSKDGKLAWPENHDYKKGRRRFRSDLVPAAFLVARYFASELVAIDSFESALVSIDQKIDELREEQGGEDGLLAEVIEGDGDKQRITPKAIKARLRDIGLDPEFDDERQALEDLAVLLDKQTDTKVKLKRAQEDLDAKLDAKYPKLTQDEVKSLVIEDKWLATLTASLHGEQDRVSRGLTGRIRQLAERYATPLPKLIEDVADLAIRVEGHLKKMGVLWK
jgi:type I restriction enzyme M protein